MTFPFRRQHKYKAKPTSNCPHCGRKHPSQVEAARCAYWHLLKKAGEIIHVDVHPTVTLPCGNYAADFAIWKDGEVFYEDVKGMETDDWRIKRREFDRFHPAAPLRVTVGRKNKHEWVWEDSDEKKERLAPLRKQRRQEKKYGKAKHYPDEFTHAVLGHRTIECICGKKDESCPEWLTTYKAMRQKEQIAIRNRTGDTPGGP